MPQVLCTLPNASTEISGVKFSVHANGMLSDEISDDAAAVFASIPGYALVGMTAADREAAEHAAEAAKADLLARAAAIEFKTKANWSLDRLKTEVEAAEVAKAAKA